MMTGKPDRNIGKLLYGFAFVVALPLLLIVWAGATRRRVILPALDSLAVGLAVAACGAGVMLSGMIAIYVYGGVLGAVIGGVLIRFFLGEDWWLFTAAFSADNGNCRAPRHGAGLAAGTHQVLWRWADGV